MVKLKVVRNNAVYENLGNIRRTKILLEREPPEKDPTRVEKKDIPRKTSSLIDGTGTYEYPPTHLLGVLHVQYCKTQSP
jgi:hypothetical protein